MKMVTINFNIAAETALGEESKSAFSLLTSAPSPENKQERALEAPNPAQVTASAGSQNDGVPPAPTSGHTDATHTSAPRPTDSGSDKQASEAALPTPTDSDEGGRSVTPEPGAPTSAASALPQPTTDANDSSQETAQRGIPTPNDTTSLAEEVNGTIGKTSRKSTRSKSTRSRSTTKKK